MPLAAERDRGLPIGGLRRSRRTRSGNESFIQAELSSCNIAEYFENAIRKIKAEASKSSDILELALVEAYDMLETKSLHFVREKTKEGNRKIKNAGTCALTVVVVGNTVYVANAGDSKGILIYENE